MRDHRTRILLCHGRHPGGVLRNHHGGVPSDVRGDEAIPIRIPLVVAQTAGQRADDPTGVDRVRHDHVLEVVAGERREVHPRGRVRGVAAGENRKEHLRGRALVAAAGEKRGERLRGHVPVVGGNESVEEGRVRGHAPAVAERDRVDHRHGARRGEWEGCPIRLGRMPHGTLVQKRQRGGGRDHCFRDWRQSPRKELSG